MKTFNDFLSESILNESGNIKVYFIKDKLFSMSGFYTLSKNKMPDIDFEIVIRGSKFTLETKVSKSNIANIQDFILHLKSAEETSELLNKLCLSTLDMNKLDFEKTNNKILDSLKSQGFAVSIIEK